MIKRKHDKPPFSLQSHINRYIKQAARVDVGIYITSDK